MAEPPLSPEEIAHRGFATAFRGFDTSDVRAYLGRVADELKASIARERELHKRVADAEHRAAHPVLDSTTLSRAVGDETTRILASAQEAAHELKARAEDNVARMLREAHDHAQRVRAEAEAVLNRRRQEVDVAVAEARQDAEARLAAMAEQSRQEAAAAMAEVDTQARQLVEDAQAARAQVLGDLTRRRRIVQAQVEQLRAGRGRLLDAYRVVRRTLDEVTVELEKVEAEARQAAGAVARESRADAEVEAELAQADPPETAGDAAIGASGPEPEPPPAETPPVATERTRPDTEPAAAPVEERRVSSLRILRPADGVRAELDVVEPPAAIEEVRVLGPTAEPAPGSAAIPAPAADDGPEVPEPSRRASPVDELFARIRADRTEAVNRARATLAEGGPEAPSSPTAGEPPVEPTTTPPTVEDADDEGLRERRDAAVEDIRGRLARRLKRALQDEQNEVLDRLREVRGRPTVLAVLLDSTGQTDRYAAAAADLLAEAAAQGAAFVSGPESSEVALDEVVADLVETLRGPLHRSLETGLAAGDDDMAVLGDRISAAYRECRVQRVERAAADATVAAFCRGTLAVAFAPLRWIVDDDGVACPDCDDNALAGATPPGDAYPTGQPQPPAHAGCRCLLAPAR